MVISAALRAILEVPKGRAIGSSMASAVVAEVRAIGPPVAVRVKAAKGRAIGTDKRGSRHRRVSLRGCPLPPPLSVYQLPL